MPNLSIKNVPGHVVTKLRLRAAHHHRSLQGELLELICRATEEEAFDNIRSDREHESSGWLSLEEVASELKMHQRNAATNVPLAADILRDERDRR